LVESFNAAGHTHRPVYENLSLTERMLLKFGSDMTITLIKGVGPVGYSPDPKAVHLSAESGFGLRPDPVG